MALVTVSIDDTNTTLISYQGDWTMLVGSSRQWNSTVHTTLTPDSSATFRFRGYQVWVWGTIPAGSGSNLYGVSIDGSVPNITSRASNGSANFEDSFYESPLLTNTYHEIVVVNKGSSANGNTEFMLDRFEFATMDETPLFTTPGFTVITSSTTSSSSGTSTPTHSTVGTSGGGKKTPVAAIAGAVIAVLVVIIAVLCYLLWRKSRRGKVIDVTPRHGPIVEQSPKTSNGTTPHNPLLPVPYKLDAKSVINTSSNGSPVGSGSGTLPGERQMSQKSGYHNFQQSVGMLASTSSLIGGSPVPAATTSSLRTSSSNRDDQSRAASASSPNDASSSTYSPQSVHQVVSPLRPLSEVVSPAGDHTELPPPSYSRDATGSPSVLSYKS